MTRTSLLQVAILSGNFALGACAGPSSHPLVDPSPGRETVHSIALVVEAPAPSPELQQPVSGPFEGGKSNRRSDPPRTRPAPA